MNIFWILMGLVIAMRWRGDQDIKEIKKMIDRSPGDNKDRDSEPDTHPKPKRIIWK